MMSTVRLKQPYWSFSTIPPRARVLLQKLPILKHRSSQDHYEHQGQTQDVKPVNYGFHSDCTGENYTLKTNYLSLINNYVGFFT